VSAYGGHAKSFHGAGRIKIRALADFELSKYVRQSPMKDIKACQGLTLASGDDIATDLCEVVCLETIGKNLDNFLSVLVFYNVISSHSF
jgi:hypothetical protein